MEELYGIRGRRRRMEPRFDQAAHDARLAAAFAEQQEVQRRSVEAMAAIKNPRELEMVQAIDAMLGAALGSADGYLGDLGIGATRQLQRALASYGVTPDYGGRKIRPTLATN